MRLKGLDLNLLIAFDVLCEERSVTDAAKRLHLSQSAMSGILSRLRQHFGDPLLESRGRGLTPTAFAQGLIGPVRDVLGQLEAVADASPDFDPSTTRRHFTIATSDYIATAVLPALIPDLARSAPGLSLSIHYPSDELATKVMRGDLDLVITAEGYLPTSCQRELLFEDDYVALLWAGRSDIPKQGPAPEKILNSGHILARFSDGNLKSYAEMELERMGQPPRAAVIVPSFSVIPALLIGTDLVAVVQRRLAAKAASHLPVHIMELPVPITPMREVMLFHPQRAADAGLAWLRDRLRAAADA